MAGPQSINNSQNLLKVLYPDDISTPGYLASKLIGMMGKDTEFVGAGTKYVVVSIAPGAGGSGTIAQAIGNLSPTLEVRFSLGRRTLYEVGSITGEAFVAGTKGKGAIVELLKHQMDRSRYSFGRANARCVWSDGSGQRGIISAASNVATATITLSAKSQVAGFFNGMVIQLVNPGTGILRAGGQTLVISNVVRNDGSNNATLTVSGGNWNQVAGAAASDIIIRAGDQNVVPIGVLGWNPIAQPGGGDSFLGVNRGTAGDVNYLSGFRVGPSGPKAQTLIDAGAEGRDANIDVTDAYLNALDMRDVFKDQSTYKVIPVETDNPKVGYNAIELLTGNGTIRCHDETDVPRGNFWIMKPESWTMRSAGDVPMLLNFDGLKLFMRNPNGDDYQYRLGAYFNFEQGSPGDCIVGTF
jgi:hypothetical protein